MKAALGALRRHPGRLLFAVLAGAILARLAFVALFGHTLSLETSGYDTYAVNLLAGNGYTRFPDLRPDSDLPPLYPFFLVGVYATLGRSAVAVALVQIGLDVVTWLAIFGIGRRVGGLKVGLLATALTAFYPYLLYQNLTKNDTALFLALLAPGIWCIYRVTNGQSWRWALIAGLLFGLAALTKTLVLLMLPLIGLWWWRRLGLRRAVAPALILALTAVVVIAPWVARNIALHGAFTLISTNDGSNLHQGNNSCVADYLLSGWDAQWVNCLAPPPPGLSEIAESAWHREQALAYLAEHVSDWPRLFGAKLITLWTPEIMPRGVPPDARLDDDAVLQFETPLFQAARVIHLVYFTPLLILGAFGAWRGWHDRRPIAPVIIAPAAITVAYLIFHPSTRYRSPADPFVFVLAAYALCWLWARWVESASRGSPPT